MKHMINLIFITVIEFDVDTADVACNSLAVFSILKLRGKLQLALVAVIYFGSLLQGSGC